MESDINMRMIIQIGLPAGLQSVVFNISNVMIQSCVNSFGADVIAANTAARVARPWRGASNCSDAGVRASRLSHIPEPSPLTIRGARPAGRRPLDQRRKS